MNLYCKKEKISSKEFGKNDHEKMQYIKEMKTFNLQLSTTNFNPICSSYSQVMVNL